MLIIVVERWAAGEKYEPYVGRWSRLVAEEFVDWLGPAEAGAWLDVGCGTGALAGTILKNAHPKLVVGLDPSSAFIGHAQRSVDSPLASFTLGDAQALPFQDEQFDFVVSGLALNFVPDPTAAFEQMVRAAHRGGKVGVYVWDYAGRMEMMRYFWDVAGELDETVRELDEGLRFPVCQPDRLQELFRSELLDVEVRAIDVPTVFQNFDDYWDPFLGGQGPAPGYVSGLASESRERLRQALARRLPFAADGSISLVARAWAVKGYRH